MRSTMKFPLVVDSTKMIYLRDWQRENLGVPTSHADYPPKNQVLGDHPRKGPDHHPNHLDLCLAEIAGFKVWARRLGGGKVVVTGTEEEKEEKEEKVM